MPRTSRKSQAPAPPNAIVASAARIVAGRRKNLPKGAGAAWQNEAWEMLDTVGELEFYREWISNALSRCTLAVVEEQPDGTWAPATDPLVTEALAVLFDGDEGQGEMLGAMAGHLAIVGETWLVGLVAPSEDPDLDMWRVLSKDEVREQGTKWQIDRGDGEPELYDAEEVYVTRIWEKHPRKGVQANSSVRAALPILRQLVGLERRDAANLDSRLVGNGLLAIPTETTFASPSGPNDDTSDPLLDPFMAALIEAGTAAIDNPGSPEALFPILVRAPGEHLDKIKHVALSTDLDQQSMERQERLIKRLANSLDVPAEVLTGMGDINHWGQWFTDESAIKMHVEPLLLTIAGALTSRYLWPVLQGDGNPFDPALRRFRIVGETSNLRQRPNRSAEATAARADLVITDLAWAREVGFDDDDLLDPTSEEYRRKMLQKTAQGVTTADVTVAALAELGIVVTPRASEVEPDPSTTPASVTVEQVPVEVTPALGPPQQQAAAALAVAEVLTTTAVTRAWNRAGKRGRTRLPVPAATLETAMDGVWDAVPRYAALLGLDAARLTATLDRYARTLLVTGAEYDPHALATSLVSEVLTTPPAALGRSA